MQAEDAAKKRAVNQHVDYDTFKNMVWLRVCGGQHLLTANL